MMYNEISHVTCAIARISFLHAKAKYVLHNLHLSDAEFLTYDSKKLRYLGLCSEKQGANYVPELCLELAKRDFESLDAPDFHFIPYWSSEYPSDLRQIYDPPFGIYVRSLQNPAGYFHARRMIAMVGTRSPSTIASSAADEVAQALAGYDICVVSGLARGIDADVHRAALRSAQKGRGSTLAVLAHGIDFVYPKSHARMAAEMLTAGGVLVSEFPPDTSPLPYRFPQRNRIISGLASAVVLVEAPEKSGALITADYALEQDRDLVVLGTPQNDTLLNSRRNAGARLLVEMGAPVLSTAEEILQHVFSLV